MGVIIIVFRPRDFINVGVVLKVKSTLWRSEVIPGAWFLVGNMGIYYIGVTVYSDYIPSFPTKNH